MKKEDISKLNDYEKLELVEKRIYKLSSDIKYFNYDITPGLKQGLINKQQLRLMLRDLELLKEIIVSVKQKLVKP